MKKQRSFLRRVPALLFLAAGVSVAVLVSREDGREKLSQFGESLSKAFNSAREFASDYAEKMSSRNDVSYPSYPQQPYQHNGSFEHKSEYSSAR